MTAAVRTPDRRSASFGLAGLGLVIGAVACVVVEAVVAAGWAAPGYSYVQNKVADLGSSYCGTSDGALLCSPDWLAIEITWLINGLLVLSAGLVLARRIGGRLGLAVGAVATIEAVGFGLFALFHDSPDASANGTITFYYVGAGLVLLSGETLAILVGVANRRLGLPSWLGRASVALGVVGLVAAAVTLGWAPLGLAERISIYAFLLWQVLLGAHLAMRRVRM